MKNSTAFKIIGISNGIAYLQKLGGGFKAFAESQYLGQIGSTVEVPSDYVVDPTLDAVTSAHYNEWELKGQPKARGYYEAGKWVDVSLSEPARS